MSVLSKVLIVHTGAKNNFLSRNYPEYDVWKMWILWKIGLWKCEFCEKWDFENVNLVKNEILKILNFVKNEILKMWILWKMRRSKCEFSDNS